MIKKPFLIPFDLKTGESDKDKTTSRFLSDMKDMYYDADAVNQVLDKKDRKIYEFTELGFDEVEEDLLFGTSIVYPGKIGDEYHMTKGHFHTKLDLAEVYYCLSGQGIMLMETPEGEWKAAEIKAGEAVYVPGRWAHRSINTGDEKLITFFVFRADAGHDYGTIETKGYRKLVVERDGKPTVIDNPKWE